jgi:hypothetical protein
VAAATTAARVAEARAETEVNSTSPSAFDFLLKATAAAVRAVAAAATAGTERVPGTEATGARTLSLDQPFLCRGQMVVTVAQHEVALLALIEVLVTACLRSCFTSGRRPARSRRCSRPGEIAERTEVRPP